MWYGWGELTGVGSCGFEVVRGGWNQMWHEVCVVVEAGEQKCMMQYSCVITFVGVGNFTQFRLQFWIYSCVFHKLFKITNILIYTLLMTKDMSTRVVKISFYIWHFKFTYHHYKQQFSQSILEIPTICTHRIWFAKLWLKHRLKSVTLIN